MLVLMLAACNRSAPTSESDQDRESRVAVEAAKLVEERARQEAKQIEERALTAQELQEREEKRLAAEAAKMEGKAAERARRVALVAELKDFLDTAEIIDARINNLRLLKINGDGVSPGSIITSYSGHSVTFTGQDGDYFLFSYSEPQFEILLRRTLNGLTFASTKTKDGIEPTLSESYTTALSAPTSRSAPVSLGRGVIIMEAMYGAESTWRDVKAQLQAQASNGRIDFRVGNHNMGGDPIFGKRKQLRVKYVAGGRIQQKEWQEGDRVNLP
jgi:hypothetical protein